MSQTYNPSLFLKAVRGTLISSLSGIEKRSLVDALCTIVKSDKNSEVYAWIGEAPAMAEITDETVPFTPMSDTSYTITNKTFASGIAVARTEIEDDQIGAVRMRIGQLSEVALQHKNALVVSLLTTNGNGYDGAAFFSDTHTARGSSGTQDNLLGGSGTSTANIADDINSGISTMLGFKAENGQPFNEDLGELTIVAPPLLRKPVLEALNSTLISNTSNVQVEGLRFRTIFTPRLSATDANDWYMLHTGGAVKPFIFQDRVPLSVESLEEDSETSLRREQYLYKVRGRYNAGYAYWQNAVKFVV